MTRNWSLDGDELERAQGFPGLLIFSDCDEFSSPLSSVGIIEEYMVLRAEILPLLKVS